MEDYTGLVKSLRWLSYMFPETHPAKDDTDRISNNIHLYCKSAADAIEELSKPRWIPVTERLPEKQGRYLVVKSLYGSIGNWQEVVSFAKNLHAVDKYDFSGVGYKRPGWYSNDSEYGYYEITNVTHWMPLPELPKEDE